MCGVRALGRSAANGPGLAATSAGGTGWGSHLRIAGCCCDPSGTRHTHGRTGVRAYGARVAGASSSRGACAPFLPRLAASPHHTSQAQPSTRSSRLPGTNIHVHPLHPAQSSPSPNQAIWLTPHSHLVFTHSLFHPPDSIKLTVTMVLNLPVRTPLRSHCHGPTLATSSTLRARLPRFPRSLLVAAGRR